MHSDFFPIFCYFISNFLMEVIFMFFRIEASIIRSSLICFVDHEKNSFVVYNFFFRGLCKKMEE